MSSLSLLQRTQTLLALCANRTPTHTVRIPSHELAQQGFRCAVYLDKWGASESLQAATILHSSVQNGVVDAKDIRHYLGNDGERVITLVEMYTQVMHTEVDVPPHRSDQRARLRSRLFAAAYRDPELAFLAVAHLWEHFQKALRGTAQQRSQYCDEGRRILSPFLDMLGMRELKEELDLALWRIRDGTAHRVENMAEHVYTSVRSVLLPHLPDCQVVQRAYAFTQGGNAMHPGAVLVRLPQVLDISVVVQNEEDCYRALHRIHRLFEPVDGAFADYLRAGRINGARALQTSVTVRHENQHVRVNFYIATDVMEEVNRWGLAALYMRQRLQVDLPNAWWYDATAGLALIDAAPPGSLPDTLSVFSPQGQLFSFHRGCTVVDYAYHVHTDLADQCQNFYVNDEMVEPNAVLHHLDLVALAHNPRAPGPTQIWLNAARTGRARAAIERWLKRHGAAVDQGQRLLNQRLGALESHYGFHVSEHRLGQATAEALRRFKLTRAEDLLTEIAGGRIMADQVLHPLFADEIIRQIRLPRQLGVRPHQVQLAQCCRPRPGEDIVGLPTRRHGKIARVRVHRRDCQRIQVTDEIIDLKWRLQLQLNTLAQIEVTAHDEDGLLGDAVRQIYAHLPRVTLHKVEAEASHGRARLRFNLEAQDQEVLEEIAEALRLLANRSVAEVRQLHLPPSEVEAAMRLGSGASYNPYSRLPVSEQAMFFGRSQELARIIEWLRAGVGNIWLLGQKRVGKTSLLLHLKRHYLPQHGFVPVFIDFQLLGNVATANLFYEVANAVYSELQTDPRIGEQGPPLRAMFEHHPPTQFIDYIQGLQSRLGANRLVLLLDEFSRTTDAYLQGKLDRSFFDAWRGLLQTTIPQVNYVTVIQRQTYDALEANSRQHLDDPSWHLMELGEKMLLKSLSVEDVHRLIEWPMRNYLEFTAETVDSVAQLTGGNPFLIQAFCFKLLAHMAACDRRRVEWNDIEMVVQEFMAPTESVFAHFLDMIRGIGNQVVQQVALLAEQAGNKNRGGLAQYPVNWQSLQSAVPNLPEDRLRRTLDELTDMDILVHDPHGEWRFSSVLFQRWLALYPV